MRPESAQEWKCFEQLHMQSTQHASQLPNLPTTITVTGDATTSAYLAPGETAQTTYNGTPCKLLHILPRLRRYDRPFIKHNPFEDPPPNVFPTTPRESAAAGPPPCSDDTGEQEVELRDPRVANNVTHILNTESQRKKGLQVGL
jgi:hypothetical protein